MVWVGSQYDDGRAKWSKRHGFTAYQLDDREWRSWGVSLVPQIYVVESSGRLAFRGSARPDFLVTLTPDSVPGLYAACG